MQALFDCLGIGFVSTMHVYVIKCSHGLVRLLTYRLVMFNNSALCGSEIRVSSRNFQLRKLSILVHFVAD